MNIGERIKKKRLEKGLSLEKVGEYLGITAQTIHKYENGIITGIPSDKIELLSELFEISPSYLMGWSYESETHLSKFSPDALIIAALFDKADEIDKATVRNVLSRYNLKKGSLAAKNDGKERIIAG